MHRFLNSKYLREHPNHVVVVGTMGGGIPIPRDVQEVLLSPQVHVFPTKRSITGYRQDYYTVAEYLPVFERALERLEGQIAQHPAFTFIITMVGAGSADEYDIFSEVVKPAFVDRLRRFPNVELVPEFMGL